MVMSAFKVDSNFKLVQASNTKPAYGNYEESENCFVRRYENLQIIDIAHVLFSCSLRL